MCVNITLTATSRLGWKQHFVRTCSECLRLSCGPVKSKPNRSMGTTTCPALDQWGRSTDTPVPGHTLWHNLQVPATCIATSHHHNNHHKHPYITTIAPTPIFHLYIHTATTSPPAPPQHYMATTSLASQPNPLSAILPNQHPLHPLCHRISSIITTSQLHHNQPPKYFSTHIYHHHFTTNLLELHIIPHITNLS